MTTIERIRQTKLKADTLERQRKLKQKQQREEKRKLAQRRNYVIGDMVTRYFPEVSAFAPGTKEDNMKIFEPLEIFLSILASDRQLVQELKNRVSAVMEDSSDVF